MNTQIDDIKRECKTNWIKNWSIEKLNEMKQYYIEIDCGMDDVIDLIDQAIKEKILVNGD